jgi:hypothetical protein
MQAYSVLSSSSIAYSRAKGKSFLKGKKRKNKFEEKSVKKISKPS